MFTNNDVLEILKVVESKGYDHFEYETDDFSLILENGSDGWSATSQVKKEANLINASGESEKAEVEVSKLAEDSAHLKAVQSPLPGTFYSAPKPGDAPFVEIGTVVKADTVVCIVESMKLMNSVPAGKAGKVAEICLEDGDFVEKNGVLIRIDPEAS